MFARTSLSGFPEWLPGGRIVEQNVLDHLREVFELHGFTSLHTRAVEPVGELQRKGETSKEVYVLSRIHDPQAEVTDKTLGLHFDLTVPFARYVLENRNQLAFPFRRYQIQHVWRGERPQDGRYREFIQADIDIVADGDLPRHYESELPLVMFEALSALPIPPVTIMINNRKIVQGFCEGIGVDDIDEALRAIDKIAKVGPDGVKQILTANGVSEEQADKLLALAGIRGGKETITNAVTALGVENETLQQGLQELNQVLQDTHEQAGDHIVADLSITRGLDYYTGTVYETIIEGHEDLGSICSGGRYDSLASDGKRSYLGVGMSIGVSRLLSRMSSQQMIKPTRTVPTCVLVAVANEQTRGESNAVARVLRQRGIATEVSPKASKFGKQIKYADKRGIPFVCFLEEDQSVTVKDLRTGQQEPIDPATWMPAAEDLKVRVVSDN
ncbi:MAG: histidine--tRNA ligase [Actinomycetaceae bacterium]|nr:histidine--tRNA ligase [Actinomycetaceae bacterium]